MAKNRYDQDEELVTKLNKDSLKKMLKYLKPHTKTIVITLMLMFAMAIIELLPPYAISEVIDNCIPNKDFVKLYLIVAGLTIGMLVVMIFHRIRSRITNEMATDIIKDLRSDLFRHMQYLPLSFFDSRPHGKILVRVVNYFNAITNLFANGIFDLITNLFKMVVIIVFMFMLNVKFTLVCLAVLPFFAIILMFIRTYHRKAWHTLSSKQSNLNAYLQESISGMKITQAFAREDVNAKIFDGLCKENKKYWMKAKYIERLIPAFVSILSIFTVLLIYYLGVGGIEKGTVTIGLLIAFVAYVSEFWQPVISLTALYNEIINCSVYIERIFEMLEEPLVVEDLPDAQDIGDVEGYVDFENVTFSYEEGTPNIFENVSFHVEKGETIALVGPTGAGKSTIINTLSRFYDINGGRILIDGKDIKHVTLNSLHNNLGIMLQDSYLFSGSVMENIRYGRLDATDDEVIEAAKAVCAHDFIMEFPEGYNTYINEGGTSLSAGQKQLIAFARALLNDPAILILDEATSSIDTETEIALQKGLDRLLEGRTSFIIAHRLSTIKNSSRIMYICDKNIAECGSHDELIAKKGKYYSLYMAQYKFLEDM